MTLPETTPPGTCPFLCGTEKCFVPILCHLLTKNRDISGHSAKEVSFKLLILLSLTILDYP